MSLIDYLGELRKRIIKAGLSVVLASIICYSYAADLVHLITLPAGKLYYLNPAEAFFTYLKVAMFGGFLLALSVIVYQTWAFVVPALTNQEYKITTILLPASIILFFIGLLFSYSLVLPVGIKFFMGFATENLQPLFSLGEYQSFAISILLPFGFIFEVPIIVVVLAKLALLVQNT